MTKKTEEKKEETADTDADNDTDTDVDTEEDDADADSAAGESDDDKSDEDTEDEDKAKDSENDIDLDAELEKEKKGKPDPKIAAEAFKKRDEKRSGDEDDSEDEDGEDDRPLTKKEVRAMLDAEKKAQSESQFLELAKSQAPSDKAAQLIFEKWRNRSFPSHLTLQEQFDEAYAITYSKKIIGERNEAVRALKNRRNVSKDGSSTHHDAPKAGEPKLSPQDLKAIKAVGYVWDGASRRFQKKLSNGDTLVWDSKAKKTTRIPARR